jgi:hypothetical protein
MICQPKLYLPQQQHGTRLFRYFFSFSFFFGTFRNGRQPMNGRPFSQPIRVHIHV